VTSRAYNDAQLPCVDGGIYVRPDKIIDWIESKAGPVSRGPEPTAGTITAVRGTIGETQIVANDPRATEHTYTIKTAPMHGTAMVDAAGKVSVCTKAERAIADVMFVTVADKADPTRALDVRIDITVQDGAPGTCNGVPPAPEPEPEPEPEPPAPADPGGCDSGRGASGSLPLALAVGMLLAGRRRRVRRGRSS
jgi:uncharacterized protein (TIGR03382 family)